MTPWIKLIQSGVGIADIVLSRPIITVIRQRSAKALFPMVSNTSDIQLGLVW